VYSCCMKNTSDLNPYMVQRNAYLPADLKLIFVLESPPTGPAYFYNENGRVSELLFRALMKVLFGRLPATKAEGLTWFAEAGYLLVDPIYTPVDKLPEAEADRLIAANYENFMKDLQTLMAGRNVPLILVKKNICRLLEPRLTADGFTVLNHGTIIPFPMHYRAAEFERKVRDLLDR
jgi:hypothetical protein